jgi:hypothetical protein
MATQTRRTTRCSATFFRATVTASMVTTWCGLLLFSAVAAHAGVDGNGLPFNGIPLNGVPLNGMPIQGLPMNGLPTQGVISHDLALPAPTLPREPLSAVQHESLPFHSVSQKALGTAPPVRIGYLRPCSRYQLGPLCL